MAKPYTTPDSHTLAISKVHISNFRLLANIDINLSSDGWAVENHPEKSHPSNERTTDARDPVTVLIGHNNSGKTSLAEALIRFTSAQSPKFSLQDFSSLCHEEFYNAWQAYTTAESSTLHSEREVQARERLPEILVRFHISYSPEMPSFGPLSELIIDLVPECNTAIVEMSYSLQNGKLSELFGGITPLDATTEEEELKHFLDALQPRIPRLFERTITAIDPTNPKNRKTDIPIERLRQLITVDFLQAQRGLDDEKERPKDPLAQVFQSLFEAASHSDDDSSQKMVAERLQKAVEGVEQELGGEMSDMMRALSPALEDFGYPGLASSAIEAKTSLDISNLLRSYTTLSYPGDSGVTLPESYSGLGSRNLILILFKLLAYYRMYVNRGDKPGLHLIFIEEPEAHLHPQMQEVFIEQLGQINSIFSRIHSRDRGTDDVLKQGTNTELYWSPQFIVTTHSSHIANRAPFSTIRYFRVPAKNGLSKRETQIKDLSTAEGLDSAFLHQYLTLTASDLFFADKAILVEGTSERLLIPAMIRKEVPELAKQYVSILEVGGFYADKFYPLLDFLGIQTLVITDLDAVDADGKKSCVHQGVATSNTAIKNWFNNKKITPAGLLEPSASVRKIQANRRIAYQIPEDGLQSCGRTLEDALIFANPSLFDLNLTRPESDKGKSENVTYNEEEALKKAKKLHKTTSAIEFAVVRDDWGTPKYILEGLLWLAGTSLSSVAQQPAVRMAEINDA
ncbi:hypothetical protein A6F49_04095 [Enteractinococcus helveticum]|uniref:AAA+ ATPase domain-containing protein n=1 Tax=Enteractinococcus helveticum TaxID=1837282 RepID=A0A1B7M2U8_9MICC|nr:hypothetical protein A6F49_04095 [Enteractinococcus helveticum]